MHTYMVHTGMYQLNYTHVFYHILELHTQYHFPQSKVKEMCLHIVSGKLGLDQYILVCTSDEQVHTHTDHTHTSLPIRHHHHCDAHKSPPDACPTLCGQILSMRSLLDSDCQATQARLATSKHPQPRVNG
jgi:hypothetical protein